MKAHRLQDHKLSEQNRVELHAEVEALDGRRRQAGILKDPGLHQLVDGQVFQDGSTPNPEPEVSRKRHRKGWK